MGVEEIVDHAVDDLRGELHAPLDHELLSAPGPEPSLAWNPLATGCEVELGFVQPSWANIDPVDPGTRRVVTDGCRIWYDQTGLLSRLLDAVRE